MQPSKRSRHSTSSGSHAHYKVLSDSKDSQQDKEFAFFLSEQEKNDFTKRKRRQQKMSQTSAELEEKLVTMKNELNAEEKN